MTLLVTDISALGIVCASDSAITFKTTSQQQSWPKLFPIQRLQAVIGYYGHAEIGTKRLPDWIETFIRQTATRNPRDFAHALQQRLDLEWSNPYSELGTGFHLAGYAPHDDRNIPYWTLANFKKHGAFRCVLQATRTNVHSEKQGSSEFASKIRQSPVPYFYHIWNHKGLEGKYQVTGSGFRVTQDFPEPDMSENTTDGLKAIFARDWSRVFRNGELKFYTHLASSLYGIFKTLWLDDLTSQPETIGEWAWYYRFQLETVKHIYKFITNTKRPLVGHPIVIFTIDPTGNIRRLKPHR